MTASATIQREWLAAEFSKGIEAEHAMIEEAKARIRGGILPTLQVLYNEIATADDRHRTILETIAVRYGHSRSRTVSGGLGDTLLHLKDKVSEMGASPLQRLGHDLSAKANAIHWYKAWIAAFQTIDDAESARELTAILTEENSHLDALQEGLNQLVTLGATMSEIPKES